MDTATITAQGFAPLDSEFARIAAVKDLPTLATEVARLHAIGVGALVLGIWGVRGVIVPVAARPWRAWKRFTASASSWSASHSCNAEMPVDSRRRQSA